MFNVIKFVITKIRNKKQPRYILKCENNYNWYNKKKQ